MRRATWAFAAAMLAWPACGGALGPSNEEPTQAEPSEPSQPAVTGSASTGTTVTTAAPPSSVTTNPPPTQATTASTLPTGAVPAEFLAAVLADAASRTGLGTGDLEVVKVEAAEWSDGSLGCPEPGVFYTQAVVSGFWVVIETSQGVLDYRLDATGGFRFCEAG